MDRGQLITVVGDATDPNQPANENIIIPHVCNDIGAWGAGFVLALSRKWDEPERDYLNYCKTHKSNILGETIFTNVGNDIWVANMIAQRGVDGFETTRPLRYASLVTCMQSVTEYGWHIASIVGGPVSIHCPKFGSALAGGNWEFITALIQDLWLDCGFDVTVYEFQG